MRTWFAALLLALVSSLSLSNEPAPAPDATPGRIAELIGKLDGGSMGERVRAKGAYEELCRIGKPAVPQLIEAAKSEKPWVRVWAGAALASSRDPRAVEPLLALLKDPFPTAREIATWHASPLYKLDPRIGAAIVHNLADPHPDVRAWAERALTQNVPFASVTGGLEKMARSDSPAGRTAAFKLLTNGRRLEWPAVLDRTLKEEKDWHLRSAAVRCLGGGVMPAGQPLFDFLFRALDDENLEVKADGIEVMDLVLKEHAKEIPAELRARVTAGLADKLAPLLDAPLPRLRGAALFLLAAHDREKLLDRALKFCDDPAPEVRAYALRALGRCGVKNERVTAQALARLSDDDLLVRRTAIATLSWATGGKYEFKPDDSAEARAKAVADIRAKLTAQVQE